MCPRDEQIPPGGLSRPEELHGGSLPLDVKVKEITCPGKAATKVLILEWHTHPCPRIPSLLKVQPLLGINSQ